MSANDNGDERDRESDLVEDDDEDAFLDLEDPDNEILDDGPAAENGIEDEDDDDPTTNADGSERDGMTAGEEPTDKTPIRDDAIQTFTAEKPLHCVATHPTDEGVYAVGGENDCVTVLNMDGSPSRVLSGHTDTITQVAFSPNGSYLASGSMDCTVRIWSTETWDCVHTFEDLSGEIEVLLWHPSGLVLVGGAEDAQAVMWNVVKGTVVQYFSGHRARVQCLVWTPDVKKLVTGSADGSVIIFNPKTGEHDLSIAKDLSEDGAGVTALAFLSPDSLCVGCEDGTLHLVSLARGKVVTHLAENHSQGIEAIAVNAELGFYATCSCDCVVSVWNLSDNSLRATFNCGEGVTRLIWNGPALVCGCTDGDVRVWDARHPSHSIPIGAFIGHRRLVLDVALSANKSFLISAADDGACKVYRYAAMQPAPAEPTEEPKGDAATAVAAEAEEEE